MPATWNIGARWLRASGVKPVITRGVVIGRNWLATGVAGKPRALRSPRLAPKGVTLGSWLGSKFVSVSVDRGSVS